MIQMILVQVFHKTGRFMVPKVFKQLLVVVPLFFALANGTLAQRDSLPDKIQMRLSVDLGAVLSLPKDDKENSILYVPARIRHYFGLSVIAEYKKINLEIGIQRFTYPVAMGVKDTAVMTGNESAFNGEYTAYKRFPLSIGYDISLKNRNFDFEPYLTGGILRSISGISYLSTKGEGSLITSGDTITNTLTHGIQRTRKSVFYGGVGAKLMYKHKKWVISLNIAYFQTLRSWGTLYGVYERQSTIHGSLLAKQSFGSVDRNITAGITVGRKLLK